MTNIPDQFIDSGAFVPETFEWDVESLRAMDVNSKEFKELLVRMYQNMNQIAVQLNQKDTGLYLATEYNTGKKLYGDTAGSSDAMSPIYRIVIDTGALTHGVQKTLAHGLAVTSSWKFISMYGTVWNNAQKRILPGPTDNTAQGSIFVFYIDYTNIYLYADMNIFGTHYNLDGGIVILEYTKY